MAGRPHVRRIAAERVPLKLVLNLLGGFRNAQGFANRSIGAEPVHVPFHVQDVNV